MKTLASLMVLLSLIGTLVSYVVSNKALMEPETKKQVTVSTCDDKGNLLLVTGNTVIPVTTTKGAPHRCSR